MTTIDRRKWGVLVLAVVLFAAILVPNLHPKSVSGTASAGGVVPGPPSVGTCLQQAPDGMPWAYDNSVQFMTIPTVKWGDCDGSHFGEVTQVLPDQPPQFTAPNATESGPSTAVWDECPATADSYLGQKAAEYDPWGWQPSRSLNFTFAGPDVVQQAAGQKWIACIMITTNGTPTAYRGVARDAFRTGRLPPPFAVCTDDPQLLVATKDCSEPHRFEILAITPDSFADDSDPQSPGDRRASCRALAAASTRLPDPTAGGRLVVLTIRHRAKADGTPVPVSGPFRSGEVESTTCGMGTAGSARLTDTLVGIGSGRLPLTG